MYLWISAFCIMLVLSLGCLLSHLYMSACILGMLVNRKSRFYSKSRVISVEDVCSEVIQLWELFDVMLPLPNSSLVFRLYCFHMALFIMVCILFDKTHTHTHILSDVLPSFLEVSWISQNKIECICGNKQTTERALRQFLRNRSQIEEKNITFVFTYFIKNNTDSYYD